MIHEKDRISLEKLRTSLSLAGYALILSGVSLWAFSSQVRREIKESSEGYCQDCGTYFGIDNLIAAHLNHQRGSDYNSRSNGLARCLRCEAEYHLSNAHNPETIGMRKLGNDPIVYGHVMELSETEREELIARYSDQWQGVLKRMKKNR